MKSVKLAILFLLAISITSCRENFTLTPSTAPAGATITLSSINLGTGKGQNSLLYDGQQVEIVSWTNNEIKFKVPANKPNGTYTVTLVMKSPNPIETVSKPHTVLNTTTVEFKAYDLDALVGSNIDARALGDAGNMSFCIAYNDQNFQTMHTTVVNSQAGTLSTPVSYNVPGTWVAEANGVSPNCQYVAGFSDPATGWEMGNPDGIDEMAALAESFTFTSDVNSSGVFVGDAGGLSTGFRWSSSNGSELLLSLASGVLGTPYAVDGSGNAYGSAITSDYAREVAVMWPHGTTEAIELPDSPVPSELSRVVDAIADGSVLAGFSGNVGSGKATIWESQAMKGIINGDSGGQTSGGVLTIGADSPLIVGGGGSSGSGSDSCELGGSSCNPNSAFIVVKQAGVWTSFNIRNWLQNHFSYDPGAVSAVRGVLVSGNYVTLLLSDDRNGAASDKIVCIPRNLFEEITN